MTDLVVIGVVVAAVTVLVHFRIHAATASRVAMLQGCIEAALDRIDVVSERVDLAHRRADNLASVVLGRDGEGNDVVDEGRSEGEGAEGVEE